MPDFPIREEIAARAYEIYLSRGAEAGRELEDWLQAEEELLLGATAPRASAAAAGSASASAPAAVSAGSTGGRTASATAARASR